MIRKIIVIALAVSLALTSCALAEEAREPQTVSGYYIVNFAQSDTKVNLNVINESDLLAAAQQAGTVIYDFEEDGTVRIFDSEGYAEGTYSAQDGKLKIENGGSETQYEYEFIDGLLVVREGEESSVFYSFVMEDLDHISIEDYSAIEINEKDVTVTEENIDSYINTVLQGQTAYEQITEGTVEEGDIITISFKGVLEGEEEPFEGGSSDSVTFMLGSGALIDGFEDQLIGQEIGSELDVKVTFPEDYDQIEGLAGKNAVFETKILSRTQASTPEFTDEFVQEFSGKYLPKELKNVEEFREYCRQYLEEYILHAAIMSVLASKTTVDAYNSGVSKMLIEYSRANLEYAAQSYGYDADTYAKQTGYSSAQEFEQKEALSYLNISMIVNKVLTDLGIWYTADELDAGLEQFLKFSASPYSLEEYKEQAGDANMWIYRNMEYKYNRAMDSLEDRVVLIQDGTGTEEEAPVSTAEDSN